MRLADLTLGLPVILVGLVFVAAFGPSTLNLVLILGILFAPATARLARSALLSELESDYYLAAVSVGAPTWRIVLEELLPNTLPVLLARASLVAADAIFVEASLSFVGLGVQPPAASWGTLLHTGYTQPLHVVLVPDLPGPRDRDRGALAERARRQHPAGARPGSPMSDATADARRARRSRASRSSSRSPRAPVTPVIDVSFTRRDGARSSVWSASPDPGSR